MQSYIPQPHRGIPPQAAWGHQAMGIPPSTLTKLRAQALAAVGLSGKRLCTTTTLAMVYGPGGDPAVKQRQ